MAIEEGLGPRKTMIVLVIVVGCFAVLWPRILSPLILGNTQQQLKPNKFDRDAGCCEVLFASEIAALEILNAVCSSGVQSDGKLSPMAAAECRKAVNETCGVDIAAFLKRHDNVGKSTKMLLDTMRASNSSCLKEHFGVPVLSLTTHQAISWIHEDSVKQERPIMRGAGPHPAMLERGRAIPAGTPPPTPRPVTLPPHVRPPPIPGMRPPLGSPGGPVPAPKSSMGFVMPIYTICIIVFFVYTLSKILFKRTGTVPYDEISPDPQFRRRVFRDDSRSSPDKLVVTAISGLVAEVQQQMEASYAQNQQRQDVQDNGRPYTNGTIIHSGPVQIVASEYQEPTIEKIEPKEPKEPSPEPVLEKEPTPEPNEPTPEPEPVPETKETTPVEEEEEEEEEEEKESPEKEADPTDELIKLSDKLKEKTDLVAKMTGDFLDEEREKLKLSAPEQKKEKQSTPDLLEEALKEDSVEDEEEEEEEEEESEEEEKPEKSSVKVVGMETTAHSADGGAWPRAEHPPLTPLPPQRPLHEADTVQSIFLKTEIPQQSRVLVADFAENRSDKKADTKHSPLVVSGKMTLSLIQDAPRETPERDPESTVDEFTTASAVTQPAAEKEDNLSEDEVDEEIEIEEIEEEIEEEEEEEEEEKKTADKKSK